MELIVGFYKDDLLKVLTFSSSNIIVFIIGDMRYVLKAFCSSVGGGVGSNYDSDCLLYTFKFVEMHNLMPTWLVKGDLF